MTLSDRIALRLRLVVPAALLAVVALHFFATVVYLMPLSPIRLALTDVVDPYMTPLFVQKWRLFAPKPANMSQTLFAQCRAASDGEESPWVDISAPLRIERDAHRLGYAHQILRTQGLGYSYLAKVEDPLRDELVKAAVTESDDQAAKIAAEKAETDALGNRLLARVASVECDRLYGAGSAREVRMRVVQEHVRPFSARNEPAFVTEKTAFETAWAPYEAVDSY